MGLDARKPVSRGLRTTKAQTSLRRLISAFVIRFLLSIISRLATSENIAIFNCPKGILGLVGGGGGGGGRGGGGGGGGGGGASKIKMKDANFIFTMTNVTILSIFRTHAQKKYRNV